MWNLISKDIIHQKYYYSFLYMGVFAIIFKDNISYALYFLTPLLLTYMTMMSLFIGHTGAKTEIFYCSLPVTKREVVAAKYCSALFFATCFIVIATVFGFVLSLLNIVAFITFIDILTVYSVIMILSAVTFPLFLTTKNSRVISWVSLITYLVLFAGRTLSSYLVNFFSERGMFQSLIQSIIDNTNIQIYILLLVAVILYGGSFFLSASLYQNKDL